MALYFYKANEERNLMASDSRRLKPTRRTEGFSVGPVAIFLHRVVGLVVRRLGQLKCRMQRLESIRVAAAPLSDAT